MDINTVISQIKAHTTVFSGNIAGAADYANGLESVVSLPMPAAYVYPLDDDVDQNENAGWALRQKVQERIAVVVVLDNSGDRRGQAASTSVEAMKYAIFAAILNWNPSGYERANQGLRYGGGHLVGMDRARLFWQFEFVLAATITEDDGFTVAGQPLESIHVFDESLDPPVELGVLLPQAD